jgi:hypothetical protein
MVHAHIQPMSSWMPCMMSGSHVLSKIFPEDFGCGWSWSPPSLDVDSCHYFLWGYLKDHVYCTNLNNVQQLQAETKAVAKEIRWHCTTHMTT